MAFGGALIVPGACAGVFVSIVFVTLLIMIRSTRESYQNVRKKDYSLNMQTFLVYVYYWTNGGSLANGEFRDLIPSSD